MQEEIIRSRTGLYNILFKRLEELRVKTPSKSDIISFPDIFEKLCRNFSITKPQCWDVLFLLRDVGLVEIITGHGVKLLWE